ncbi:antibiotic biosynthesis monooxygenase [Chitinivorax sp. B]|uniref:antibiotic biosynthesis monooxygenase family protein n=1 Tax=Chitinivorax sp. B TaxID=2502235 RepID=UPI0010F8E12C|nr:antibiotic biosynthesis monooxygenase [Chitinivorax sp. B]
MITILFEVLPHTERQQDYLDLAADLRPQLEQVDGFLSVERFTSLTTPGKMLSLSFWRDEESVKQWRNLPQHRAAQSAGRTHIFANYRLRVASVIRDYGLHEREAAPDDAKVVHDVAVSLHSGS